MAENEGIENFVHKIQGLSIEELDRDRAEISLEIDFLKKQVKVDSLNYSQEGLDRALYKISIYEERARSLESELKKKRRAAVQGP